MEARHKHLSGQYEDLSQAKNSLERIIHSDAGHRELSPQARILMEYDSSDPGMS